METFLVRLWSPSDGGADAENELHGVVEQVSNGRNTSFTAAHELVAFLQAQLEERRRQGDGRRVDETAGSRRLEARPEDALVLRASNPDGRSA